MTPSPITKNELLQNTSKLHTTELGAERIKRNLSIETDNIADWCRAKVRSGSAAIEREGKNWYVHVDGFVLLIPFLLIRFGLLSKLSKEAIKRAAHFPQMMGNERAAYWVYQISNAAILVYLCFLKVTIEIPGLFYTGLSLYLLGLLLCAVSMIGFAASSREGLNTKGIYRFSRNPMYVSYFIYFVACALLTRSWILLGIVLVFQISAHWIILSEERWCKERFGDSYREYMRKVRRYV